MSNSKIEWTQQTWNPITGCTKVSPGCKYCYAESMSKRLKAMSTPGYENGFKLSLKPDALAIPQNRRKETMFFVNSMSDLFHESVPISYIDQVLSIIRSCPQHIFQILTKRVSIMTEYFKHHDCPDNVWLGVSVENKKHGVPRIKDLQSVKARVRFLSCEPLLEDLGPINLEGIHWVIVGGESGHKARPMNPQWALGIRDQCCLNGVPFFFKQWGSWGEDGKKRSKKSNGNVISGKIWQQFPVDK